MLPVKDVLKRYLGNDYNDDEEEEDITSSVSNNTKRNLRKLIKFEIEQSLSKQSGGDDNFSRVQINDSTSIEGTSKTSENKSIEKNINLNDQETETTPAVEESSPVEEETVVVEQESSPVETETAVVEQETTDVKKTDPVETETVVEQQTTDVEQESSPVKTETDVVEQQTTDVQQECRRGNSCCGTRNGNSCCRTRI